MERIERPTDQRNRREERTDAQESEHLGDLARYLTLAQKRVDGDLTTDEFVELFATDLKFLADQNPPIHGTFDPGAELRRIRTLPHADKTSALGRFKDNLVRQREAIMECRLALERAIEWDPDIGRSFLTEVVDFFAGRWGFTEDMANTAKDIVNEYIHSRHDVVALRQQFPDNAKLVSKLTGLQFDDAHAFDIDVGPITIDITTDEVHAKRMYPALKEYENTGHKSGGYQAESTGHILYSVTIRDASPDADAVLLHEREHAKNSILRDFFDDKLRTARSYSFARQLQTERDPALRKDMFQAIARNDRDEAFQRAKNEMLAMVKDGKSKYFDAFFRRDGNPYDYLKGLRDVYALSFDPAERAAGTEVLVKEYEHMLRNGLSAIDMLNEAGYDEDAVVALFTDLDIPHWPAMARRLTESAR